MAEITLAQGVSATLSAGKVIIKGPLGSNERQFNDALLKVEINGSKVKVEPSPANKKLAKKAMVAEQSLAKELSNDSEGVVKYFEVNMEAVYAHFPLTIEVKPKEIIIKNMLGERYPRYSGIVGKTKVEIKGNDITISGTSKDDVSQTAANLRKASKIRKKDERIFQDGVYYAVEV